MSTEPKAIPAGSAFVRQCDGCGMTTAIDLDPTPDHWRELCVYEQTVRTVPEAEAMQLWETAGQCKCGSAETQEGSALAHENPQARRNGESELSPPGNKQDESGI